MVDCRRVEVGVEVGQHELQGLGLRARQVLGGDHAHEQLVDEGVPLFGSGLGDVRQQPGHRLFLREASGADGGGV